MKYFKILYKNCFRTQMLKFLLVSLKSYSQTKQFNINSPSNLNIQISFPIKKSFDQSI